MVDHFLEQVIGQNKIGGQARAMVVTASIKRAIQYFFAFRDTWRKSKVPISPLWRSPVSPNTEAKRSASQS